ncbi:dihydroorotate dehydrogenase electron transfer subunit [Oceanobacillus sp. CAU 1775]
MRKTKMKVIEVNEIALDTFEIILEDEYITSQAVPGQFIYIALPGFTLRRPISIADINKEKQQLTILFKKLGKGTEKLALVAKDTELDVLGPNGNGFPLDVSASSTVVLIGGGIGVPPLYYLGRKLKERGIDVKAVLGFQTKAAIFYEKQFKELGETIIVTDDGTYGETGFVTDVIDQLPAFQTYYSCGPTGMLKAVKEKLHDTQGYISLEERMGCGVGACSACFIPSTNKEGFMKICHDGPVFRAKEVIL